ncbi:MAG: hypothetical protein M1587_07830, partial [Thaumarchaeota archaeon]|nr:hypothetical protein [Nitrososphaerota archaeon]
ERIQLEIIWKILRNRLALTGVIIILVFLMLAIFAPFLTNANPIYSQELASPYSPPQWATIFPAYSNLPPNTQYFSQGSFDSASSIKLWSFAPSNGTSGTLYVWNNELGPPAQRVGSEPSKTHSGSLQIMTSNNSSYSTTLSMSRSFQYAYKPPQRFVLSFYATTNSASPVSIVVGITISNGNRTYMLMQERNYQLTSSTWTGVVADSYSTQVKLLVAPQNLLANVAKVIFQSQGNYTATITISASEPASGATSIFISDTSLYVFGSVYGRLGTD